MNALLALVRAEIKLHFSNRRAVLMSIVAPILIAAFFGSLFGGNAKPAGIAVGVVDLDHSPLSERVVAALQADSNKIVLFCGDGTNDAVALAQADVGVQLGTASDVAGAVADVVLLGGLDGTLALLDISKRAFHRIVFNFAWSAAYNVFAILLASGAFVKFRVPPAYAGLGEIVSVVPVIIAAVSLLWGNVRTV